MTAPDDLPRVDFFVSYTKTDRGWAEWIAWQLEQAEYSVLIQEWDILPGHRFVEEMDRAMRVSRRTIAVVSEDYLHSELSKPEWQARVREDPTGAERALVPVRVAACDPGPLLGPIVYVDLVGVGEVEACDRLLRAAQGGRGRPSAPPPFPGSEVDEDSGPKPVFPPAVVGEVSEPRPDRPWRRALAWLLGLPPLAYAAAAVLLVALVLAAVLWPRGHASTSTLTQVGVSPRSPAIGLSDSARLWIADPTQPEAWWLDASAPRVRTGQAFLKTEDARPTGVAVDAQRRTAWVTDEHDDRAWRIDIPSKTVLGSVAVGDGPEGVTVYGGIVWVANRTTITRINALTGARLGRDLPLDNRLNAIASGDGAVWVISTTGNVLLRIDAKDPLGPPLDIQIASPRSIAVGAGAVWVAGNDGNVSRIAAGERTSIDVGDRLCGIAVGQGGVWVSAPDRDRIWRIDPKSRRRGASFDTAAAPCALAAGNGSIWVANRGDSSITRIQP